MNLNLFALLCALSMQIVSCASSLPTGDKNKIPVGQQSEGQELDSNQIEFLDLESGVSINLANHMAQNPNRAYLLIFGSKSCAACNDKAQQLTQLGVDSTSLNLDDTWSLEVIGINTDPEAQRLPALAATRKYKFIKWMDPKGAMMIHHFLPLGESPQVPFSALIANNRLVWFVDNKTKISGKELIDRSVQTMTEIYGISSQHPITKIEKPGQPISAPNVPVKPDQPETPVTHPELPGSVNPMQLVQSSPSRFDELVLESCDGASINKKVSEDTGKKLFYLADADCSDCESDLLTMQSACVLEESCNLYPLLPSGSQCRTGFYKDGNWVTELFATRLNWDAPIVSEDFVLRMTEKTGPTVLLFDGTNQLMEAHTGTVSQSDLQTWINNSSDSKTITNFPFYKPGLSGPGFEHFISDAQFTIISAFAMGCGTCMSELKHWSQENSLGAFCRDNPESCSLYAMETDLPDGVDIQTTWQNVSNQLTNENISVPLLLDATPYGADGMGYKDRFFDGYLSVTFPEWQGYFGTVIYDREGKIRAAFKSEEIHGSDPVFDKLKQLLEDL